jgi:SAM-dependent methyltransferase
MPFPFDDRSWSTTAAFVRDHAGSGDSVLANDLFWTHVRRLHRYQHPWSHPGHAYDWVVLHKGELGQLPVPFLQSVVDAMVPVFANDVFVVYAACPTSRDRAEHRHVAPLLAAVDELAARPPAAPPVDDVVLPEPGVIERLGHLDPRAFRRAMEDFWTNGGYEYPTARDEIYNADLEQAVAEAVGDLRWARALDLACGTRPLPPSLAGPGVVRADIADPAVRLARRTDEGAGRTFATCDGAALPFRDRSFDLVLFVEALEHVQQLDAVLGEVRRVLAPGGHLVVTAANRDSLHLRLARALGYPEFPTNYQHITEPTFAELTAMLADHALEVVGSAGLFLFPYWGVAGVGGAVQDAVDRDVELLEALRAMGRLVGAEHAYASLAVARRAG